MHQTDDSRGGAARRFARPVAAILVCAGLALPATAQRIRGITVSSHTNGHDWATDANCAHLRNAQGARRQLGDDPPLGAHSRRRHRVLPTNRERGRRGRRRRRRGEPSGGAHLRRPIAEAHRLGLKILIKPQLAYWGSPFSWPGAIEFRSDEKWERFFTSYAEWMLDLASAIGEADALAVGTELDRTFSGAHEGRWRELIARLRQVFPGPLTYAANWTDYQRVPFWDALDAIGVQAYFPLADRVDADEVALRESWARIMDELRVFAEHHDRYVVFTELGYDRSLAAAIRPWDAAAQGESAVAEGEETAAAAVQHTCMRLALEAIEHEPRVVGAFLWKWFPEPYPEGRDFQLASRGMRRVIAEVWGRYGAAAGPR